MTQTRKGSGACARKEKSRRSQLRYLVGQGCCPGFPIPAWRGGSGFREESRGRQDRCGQGIPTDVGSKARPLMMGVETDEATLKRVAAWTGGGDACWGTDVD